MFPLFAFDVKMRFICMRIKNEKYFSYYFTGFVLNLALTQRYGQLGNGLYIFSGILLFIIHQTHYEKSDWSRAFNQFTIACELDMINAISAADIAFIMSSSTSSWLLSPLECSPQKQNG